jgi:cysteine sulfinate desulfinase/cysteine desulfurase-like protein
MIFTSGATESNNMIVKGVARFHGERKKHVITTQTVSIQSFISYSDLTFALGA